MSGSGSEPSGLIVFGQFLSAVTNIFLIPAIVYAGYHYRKLYLEFWFCIFLYCASSSYHFCLEEGGTLCFYLTETNRVDHFFAEYVIIFVSIKLTPLYSNQLMLYSLYMLFLLFHTVIQLLQVGTIWVQVGFASLGLASYMKFHFGNFYITAGLMLGAAGLCFFCLDEYEPSGYYHCLWHIFSLLSIFFFFKGIDDAYVCELGETWSPANDPWIALYIIAICNLDFRKPPADLESRPPFDSWSAQTLAARRFGPTVKAE